MENYYLCDKIVVTIIYNTKEHEDFLYSIDHIICWFCDGNECGYGTELSFWQKMA